MTHPVSPPVMDPGHGQWVHDHVLPTRVLARAGEARTLGDLFLTRCACQYGPSGRCHAGQHDRCAHRSQPDFYDAGFPESYLLSRRTDGGHAPVLAEVWPAGHACRWRCSCPCHNPDPEAAQDRGLLFDIHGATA
ncbi:DUF6248 family natural product biosynthesis protein [Streptomyces sp. CCM_MD2014]|uniref:DUF6248 family natural product biosynthesis protein n=1 Tax=Streptomyces sp. CCM_MD2014 TaxID=1561022 RepID=UPI00052ACC6C|nr:DUF6248 family natural product biosynthesis protein [Streptomyces sp. CCM_MD2014]AIV35565.1 hypothetical protein NI25_20375 [Streptomyces sp. CCM_MD2014]